MQTEYKLFPGYARQMIRSIEKYMESKPNNAIVRNFSDPYEAFYFYLNEMSMLDICGLKKGCLASMPSRLLKKKYINNIKLSVIISLPIFLFRLNVSPVVFLSLVDTRRRLFLHCSWESNYLIFLFPFEYWLALV
nr:MAG TPA: hypothetical protein [Bacteriophage sp.]